MQKLGALRRSGGSRQPSLAGIPLSSCLAVFLPGWLFAEAAACGMRLPLRCRRRAKTKPASSLKQAGLPA
jgi:hypothetical protein